jgi:hypothetical protein
VLDSKVLREIVGPRVKGLAEDWRRLLNEELHNLQISPRIIRAIKSRTMRLKGRVARMRDMRNTYKILVREPERKRQIEKPWRGLEDNVRLGLGELGWDFLTAFWFRIGTSDRLL